MFDNLTNETLLDNMLSDLHYHKLHRVGRELMTEVELWESWLMS